MTYYACFDPDTDLDAIPAQALLRAARQGLKPTGAMDIYSHTIINGTVLVAAVRCHEDEPGRRRRTSPIFSKVWPPLATRRECGFKRTAGAHS